MAQPDQVWVTDITYIRTHESWLYLAVVIDLYSRAVVGWSMKPAMATELVLDALMMAARQLLGQCCCRVLLQQLEERANQASHLCLPPGGQVRRV